MFIQIVSRVSQSSVTQMMVTKESTMKKYEKVETKHINTAKWQSVRNSLKYM